MDAEKNQAASEPVTPSSPEGDGPKSKASPSFEVSTSLVGHTYHPSTSFPIQQSGDSSTTCEPHSSSSSHRDSELPTTPSSSLPEPACPPSSLPIPKSTDVYKFYGGDVRNTTHSQFSGSGEQSQRNEDNQSDEEIFFEEEEEVTVDSATSTLKPSNDLGSQSNLNITNENLHIDFDAESGSKLNCQGKQNQVKSRKDSTLTSRDVQHDKRRHSIGSECSLSSNPENSQFKSADAHSSDSSDASRNSAALSAVFDNVPTGIDIDPGKYDADRKSLQSDHSGEQLNTSVESFEFGTSGEHSDLMRHDSHSPRLTSMIKVVGSGGITHQGSQHKPRMKKKMWYQQIFSTSYKTRSGDFKRIFKDLPPKERLIVDYSCALQKEILLQGRMYVSQNYVSFYANIFGWETQTSVSFKEIDSITKEKTALIIPNAIQIGTLNEKFFFSSFVTRDTTYVMLFKLWQSVLLEDNMSKKELWRLVHTCYGEELGVTSEDEADEIYCPQLVAAPSVTSLITSSQVVDGGKSRNISTEACTGEIGSAIAVGLNIGSSIVTSNGTPISAEQLFMKDGTHANIVPIPVPILPMTVDPTDSSDNEAILESALQQEISGIPMVLPILPSGLQEVTDSGEGVLSSVPPACPVDHSTIGKELMNSVISCNIDQLFTMLFTNSKFYLDFQVSRKTCDINQSDWQLGDGSHKTRQLTFTVLTGQAIGPKHAQVTETQSLLPASRPGLLYVIESESANAGIPYADAFSVKCHYCLSKLSPTEANIIVISKIYYKKSIWAAKPFIEKNSMAALVDYFHHLDRSLKEECAKINAGGITPTSPIVTNLPRRRHPPRKKGRAPDIPTSVISSRPLLDNTMVHPGIGGRQMSGTTMSDTMSESASDSADSSFEMKIIVSVLFCLLLLNAFLYFKLSNLETSASLSGAYPPVAVKFSGEAPQNHQEWLILLQQQETLHRSEVHSWHEILVSAIKILHQAEKDLEMLKSHIFTYGKENTIIKPISPDMTSTSMKSVNLENLSQNLLNQEGHDTEDAVPSAHDEN